MGDDDKNPQIIDDITGRDVERGVADDDNLKVDEINASTKNGRIKAGQKKDNTISIEGQKQIEINDPNKAATEIALLADITETEAQKQIATNEDEETARAHAPQEQPTEEEGDEEQEENIIPPPPERPAPVVPHSPSGKPQQPPAQTPPTQPPAETPQPETAGQPTGEEEEQQPEPEEEIPEDTQPKVGEDATQPTTPTEPPKAGPKKPTDQTPAVKTSPTTPPTLSTEDQNGAREKMGADKAGKNKPEKTLPKGSQPTEENGEQPEGGAPPIVPPPPGPAPINGQQPLTTTPPTTESQQGAETGLKTDMENKKQLGRQRRKLESELAALENKIDGVKNSRAMSAIRFWFPAIYATISGFGSGMANAKGETKMAMLQAKLLTAQTIKGTLEISKSAGVMVEANIKALEWIAASLETIIIPILLIILYPILVFLLWILIGFTNLLPSPITKSIAELEKNVDNIIENLKKVLEPENKKIKIRKEIQVINQMMASRNVDKLAGGSTQQTNTQAGAPPTTPPPEGKAPISPPKK